jgi:hypothetical protein
LQTYRKRPYSGKCIAKTGGNADEITPQARGTGQQNRKVTPTRVPNADLRTREYLTPAEIDKLIEARGQPLPATRSHTDPRRL